ncbi:hypothetical protein [Lentibacillus daqui]|uniref:hypothetical protein n=1 Tax=Lentibacillus daqui TaxID=2911514 RepID=UPI0034E26CC8
MMNWLLQRNKRASLGKSIEITITDVPKSNYHYEGIYQLTDKGISTGIQWTRCTSY